MIPLETAPPIWHDGVMQDITIRRMAFDFPPDLDPVFLPGDPEQSFSMIGLSLLLPYLEPYLIRTMKEAKPRVTDPDLRADLANFSAQEGQHYREHIRFNETLRRSGYPGLESLERELAADYLRFSETRSLRFNLGYAEGFEALTTAIANLTLVGGDWNTETEIGRMFAWHAVEELEHRTVAFDVYDHVCGGYFRRLGIGLFGQWHMLRFILRVTNYMIGASPEIMERHGGKEGARRRREMRSAGARGLLPAILRTYLPWYTPHAIPFTEEMRRLAERFDAEALSTSQVEPQTASPVS